MGLISRGLNSRDVAGGDHGVRPAVPVRISMARKQIVFLLGMSSTTSLGKRMEAR